MVDAALRPPQAKARDPTIVKTAATDPMAPYTPKYLFLTGGEPDSGSSAHKDSHMLVVRSKPLFKPGLL